MFIGEYQHILDEKGRLAIPAKFRDALKEGAVVTKGVDGCLVVYPMSVWNELAHKLSNLPMSKSHSRAFARHILAAAMDVTVDAQGRIVLPDYLRLYGKFQKQIIVAGLYNRLELWNAELWQQYKKNTEKMSEEIAESLGEF